jgi:hypothetical protein
MGSSRIRPDPNTYLLDTTARLMLWAPQSLTCGKRSF